MPRKKQTAADQHDMLNVQERLTTAPCVPAIRQAVRAWRERNYPGATDVTRELLNFWFQTEAAAESSSGINWASRATSMASGRMSKASMVSFTSRGSIFLPRYSGVRPTIRPATKTATMAKSSMP